MEYDDLPDGVVVADAAGTVVVCNAAAAEFLERPVAEVVGRPLAEALPFSDSVGRNWWQVTDPYGGMRIRRRQVERNLSLPDGRVLLVTASYVRSEPGGPLERLVVGIRGQAARDRVEREHADLIATVAHELRSPLAGVKGFTATLLGKWERFTDAQRKLMLEAVDGDADRLTRLIAELLDVARIDSDRLELRRRPVDLADLVRRRVEAHIAAGRDGERFLVETAPELPELSLDPDKVGQVVDNLVENAFRHGDGVVTVTLGEDPDGVVLSVSDEGPGVPEQQASRIFGRFWKGADRTGSGLGLYITRGIVEAHGGRVALVPGEGGGARFVVVIPVVPPDPA